MSSLEYNILAAYIRNICVEVSSVTPGAKIQLCHYWLGGLRHQNFPGLSFLICKMEIYQWFLSGDNFDSQGTLGIFCRNLWLLRFEEWMLLAASRWSPGMLLNVL